MFLTGHYPVVILNIIGNKYPVITYLTSSRRIFLLSFSRGPSKYKNNSSRNKKKRLPIRLKSSWFKPSAYNTNIMNSKNIRLK
jgi:hypothetical protein